ncbi:MAG: tRNA preQ1(34) S-adenosylmethionine ribosyltransferase-isomerase QueA [Anaerolineaceae bacterium]|nr:MAG: tRNA preQ1(34) S-adenosylmethionine ribosyltransferase-isomerase QueA [Anaerolineaceae bacterium]
MKTIDFDYELPPEYIAQTPLEPRDASKLLVLSREDGSITHAVFHEIGNYLHAGDLLVVNKTRVIPARIYARKPTGGKVEILLLRKKEDDTWLAMLGGKHLKAGMRLTIEGGPNAEIMAEEDGANRTIRFSEAVEKFLPAIGNTPLPPYIHEKLRDPERYQTIYSKVAGSAAAPTAGLHFTQALIQSLQKSGIGFAEVLLHVGLDTFAPVNEENVEEHHIHREWCQVSAATAQRIRETKQKGGRVIAVGTTSVRTLESAAWDVPEGEIIRAYEGMTDLFILPGYPFRVVDAMVTNFHLPKSTLIMLVSAFAGWENIRNAYEVAKQEHYRFYSFGDAMFIW